jgi:hypothetical protein
MNVLISLHKGYGLGDSVQMSCVLQHARKYHPEWTIYYQAEQGKECVGNGIVDHTFCYGELPNVHYDAEIQLTLYDKWWGYTDRPNTRVTSCLKEHFNLDWDKECGTYKVKVSEDVFKSSKLFLEMIKRYPERKNRGMVAVHYQGKTLPNSKNLSDDQAWAICRRISDMGRIPVLLDWEDKSPLGGDFGNSGFIRSIGGYSFSSMWGRNIEMNCAIISQCEAFIGIDSGPAKCASATQIPSLVVWTKHHPAPFHDPAPNTTHLVPARYHELEPVSSNPEVIRFFTANYKTRMYRGDSQVEGVENWLEGILK